MIQLKKKYFAPIIEIQMIYHEESFAAASVTPHINSTNNILEEWEEAEVVFDRVQW
ncbi:hypothetical protein [Sphingobacterium sp. SGL-16]|uniref:hypothetical protein n=1 Tax=Sphingobacterium sp. SGL-16 TaxID=2710883 RepID=UPI0013EDA784|nr:hypothetical protein [Sphingobacterium sp. SGL-16]NGM74040.1 hypothetical protein [Sphingobacterium sp. SGL-16]